MHVAKGLHNKNKPIPQQLIEGKNLHIYTIYKLGENQQINQVTLWFGKEINRNKIQGIVIVVQHNNSIKNR